MTREIAVAAGMAVLVWLGYMAWLTGYKAGYGDGEEMAWERARFAVPGAVTKTDPTRLNPELFPVEGEL